VAIIDFLNNYLQSVINKFKEVVNMLTEWLEKNLEEPFFRAEMVKAQTDIVQDADLNLGTVKAMAFFGTVYMVFCVFWYAKYIV